MPSVRKEFRWEMGHRLPDHPLCKNVHGHSYRAVVEVWGEIGPDGMVIDFGEIMQLAEPIRSALDHAFALSPDDLAMREFLQKNDLKACELPFLTTAENLAGWMAKSFAAKLQGRNLSKVKVTVFETPSSAATAEQSLVSDQSV
ncbi:MAG: 6-carboxytetrahydropterin synthase [Chthonomonadaceae bacterium]|nr:6-carboxytetrahydropterin synthase [Chthonomonadaceae bacterium]